MNKKKNSDLISQNQFLDNKIKQYYNNIALKLEIMSAKIIELNKLISIGGSLTNVRPLQQASLQQALLQQASQQQVKIENFTNQQYRHPNNINIIESRQNNDIKCVVHPLVDNKFNIHINNQCLSVYGPDDYELQPCDTNKKSQEFDIINVQNQHQDIKLTGIHPFNTDYPKAYVKNGFQCLSPVSNNNSQLKMSYCNPNNINQYWNTRKDEKLDITKFY
jgi:hypothetical protein